MRENVKTQLNRLLEQLQDLEAEKDSLDEAEYKAMREETMVQLKEVQQNLNSMLKGDMTLVSEMNAVQLAIQATISEAYKTPEVIKMFANKNTVQLRQRYANLQRDAKLPSDVKIAQQVEILSALQKLGETLSPEETSFLANNRNPALSALETGAEVSAGILRTASASVKNSK
uniref:Beta-catenin-interacting ICAT domain-containing protein n=1 Tax=Arcella intermedia TaxID=1963864 RepID=A0A6B2LLF5_9EUKA